VRSTRPRIILVLTQGILLGSVRAQRVILGSVSTFRSLSDTEETVRFLNAFFSWRCDQRRVNRGTNRRRAPGIKHKSSLESVWRWWHLIYKIEMGHGLTKETIIKIKDVSYRSHSERILANNPQVLAIIAGKNNLELKRRPKATMYIEDVAEFARVLLSTTEMTFSCLRIQLILFCQLAAITGSRPGALLRLRYRDLLLTLIRDPDGGCPRLLLPVTGTLSLSRR
jgi:integrase